VNQETRPDGIGSQTSDAGDTNARSRIANRRQKAGRLIAGGRVKLPRPWLAQH